MLLYSKLDMGKNSQARGLLLAVMMDSYGAGGFVLIACIGIEFSGSGVAVVYFTIP